MYCSTVKELKDKLKSRKTARFYGFTPRCLNGNLTNCPYGVYPDLEQGYLVFSIDMNYNIISQCQNSDWILKVSDELPDDAKIMIGYCDIQGNHIRKEVKINVGNGMITAVSPTSRRGKVK
jgi:hypothetical protein